jgi:hypothetical protein
MYKSVGQAAAIQDALGALRRMTAGADEFMREVGDVVAADPGDWPPLCEELVRSTMDTLERGRTHGLVEEQVEVVLAAGPHIPSVGEMVFPRPAGAGADPDAPPPPWFDHLEGETADAWRKVIGCHTSGAAELTALLEEGISGVDLPGVSTQTAIANCVVYGSGCLVMAGGVALTGNIRRLAGALMAYMLFDHLGDSLTDRRVRGHVHKEMMRFWAKGSWSAEVSPAVAGVLTEPIRGACARSRGWVNSERLPASAVRIGPQLGALAAAIAKDCRSEGDEAAPVGTVDLLGADTMARLSRSLRKNVAAVAFLLYAYLDDPRLLRAEVLHMAGRAAMFAQLFDDLLDRQEDVEQRQDTVVTSLTPGAYRRLARASAMHVPRILEDVNQVAPGVAAMLEPFDRDRVVAWCQSGGLIIYLMARHRNRPAFGDEAADLEARTTRGESPFVILRSVREWLRLS